MIIAIIAKIHIQNIEPAPPTPIAAATPAMFPTPRVPDKERQAERKDSLVPIPHNELIALNGLENGLKDNFISKKNPAQASKIGSSGPIIREFNIESIFPPILKKDLLFSEFYVTILPLH
jgi:hypothetical protein